MRATVADIEVFRRSVNRRFWALLGLQGFITLACVFYAILIAVKPPPVVEINDGRPILYRDTGTPALETTKVRVAFFVREFLDRYVGIDATRLESDFQKALSMMSERQKALELNERTQIERRLQYENTDVVSHFADFDLRIAEFDPAAMDEDIYLFAWGRQEFRSLFGDEDPVSRYFLVKMRVERRVVTMENPYGLLVKDIRYDSFAEARHLKSAKLKEIRE